MSFFGDLIAGQGAAKASNYNASLLERDAKVQEQNAEQAYKVFEQYASSENLIHQLAMHKNQLKKENKVSQPGFKGKIV